MFPALISLVNIGISNRRFIFTKFLHDIILVLNKTMKYLNNHEYEFLKVVLIINFSIQLLKLMFVIKNAWSMKHLSYIKVF